MNQLKEYFYKMKFEECIRKKHGNEFETFFCDIMKSKYKEDFLPCQPWGKQGDKKNDGYLRSQRQLFAANGPKTLNLSRMLGKIDSDFEGAKPHWESYYDCWTFVTNLDEFPADILKKILVLDNVNDFDVKIWGVNELKEILFSLEEKYLQEILGYLPSIEDFSKVEFKDIQPVINAICNRSNPRDGDFIKVPSNKLIINGLSDTNIELIKLGMSRASLVRDYFNAHPDINLGDSIGETLNKKYEYFRDDELLNPDEIYGELYSFIVDKNKQNNTIYLAAVYSVLAYYFEQCTIFEGE